MSFFNRPLPGAVRSSGYALAEGHEHEQFVLPETVEHGPDTIPDYQTQNGTPSAWRGNTGDLYQNMHTASEGVYGLGFLDVPGPQPTTTVIAPAVGSENLTAPRDTGGVPGTNRLIHSVGPVSGTPDNAWTGENTSTVPNRVGLSGPVGGGADVGQGLSAAFYAQQNALYSQAAAESALIAAV